MANDTTPKSFRFSEEEMALLEQAKAKHGSYKAAIMAGLACDMGDGETDWPAELRRLASKLETREL
ncbi:MAG: hypothetical protein GYB49_09630 [Alphaproteobacteria bacterium]|nr:hypothetical protein [Alphaproteobacteria bacterium]